MFDDFDIIYSYSRKQAIKDGVLINVTDTAMQLGIRYPVAITSRLWREYIVPDPASQSLGQSIEGRLWDVLWLFRINAYAQKNSPQMHFGVYFLMGKKLTLIKLKAVCGPGDTIDPVFTIMMPEED